MTVFERADAPGGLLRIPNSRWKSGTWTGGADARAEGTHSRCSTNVGTDVTAGAVAEFDAIMLAGGATVARGLSCARGRPLRVFHQAMEYLLLSNRAVNEAAVSGYLVAQPAISARGQHVVIIGGGDTGSDCRTAHRQGAVSVTQPEIMPRPPELRPDHQPWPTYPMTFRVSSAHEEAASASTPSPPRSSRTDEVLALPRRHQGREVAPVGHSELGHDGNSIPHRSLDRLRPGLRSPILHIQRTTGSSTMTGLVWHER